MQNQHARHLTLTSRWASGLKLLEASQICLGAYQKVTVTRVLSQLKEPGLDLSPRRIRAIAKHPALCVIFGTDDIRQVRGRKQRIALGKAHVVGMEIAPGKMGTADLVVIRLDGRILRGLQHGDYFWLRRQLKQVVVVPGVGAERPVRRV